MTLDSNRIDVLNRVRAADTVALSHSSVGSAASGDPVVLIHGLFGSSRNWQTIAQELSELGPVYSVDQRNHGSSPHHSSHTLTDMIADLHLWHENNLNEPAVYVGHSMGGLTAMGLSLLFPELVRKLVVVDIAPRAYEPHHDREFEALAMDVSGFKSRQEIDGAMARIHPVPAVRRFLQMNLERGEEGYRWAINVEALRNAAYLQGFQDDFPDLTYSGPTLIIKGEHSNYIEPEDRPLFQKYFPSSRLVELKDADHWLHYSAQEAFLKTLKLFLQSA